MVSRPVGRNMAARGESKQGGPRLPLAAWVDRCLIAREIMSRIAIISDVHADVHALDDALGRIDAMACDTIMCAGDLIGYGLFPEETIALLGERAIQCVRGNHDRWAFDGTYNTSGWDLTPESVSFLKALRPSHTACIDGVSLAMWHAKPRSDMDGIYSNTDARAIDAALRNADADVLVVGHTHVPTCLTVSGGRLVVNPGALLRSPAVVGSVPAPGTFGVLELPGKRFTVYRAADGSTVTV
jgi:putative phosphoesterase